MKNYFRRLLNALGRKQEDVEEELTKLESELLENLVKCLLSAKYKAQKKFLVRSKVTGTCVKKMPGPREIRVYAKTKLNEKTKEYSFHYEIAYISTITGGSIGGMKSVAIGTNIVDVLLDFKINTLPEVEFREQNIKNWPFH